jgi:hypothetical protein
MKLKRTLLVTVSFCTLVVAGVSACVAQPVYNPDNLANAQFSLVSNICQTVMGLSPSEALSGGYWMGNERLDYWTSKYRGCIVSLSDSLRSADDGALTRQADADCRAKGFASGSSDLALCVLRSVNTDPRSAAPARASTASAPASEQLPAASVSYTYASPHENARREQTACAALGLEPTDEAFKSCVKGLSDTFYAIDHPIL